MNLNEIERTLRQLRQSFQGLSSRASLSTLAVET